MGGGGGDDDDDDACFGHPLTVTCWG